MDAQLVQAMGAMTLAERQRKFYASKTDEEKKELNRKKTTAAAERRKKKREEEARYEEALKKVEAEREATKGAGAGETPAVKPATPNGLLEVEFNGADFRIDPATRAIYTASGAKLGAKETHAPPVYVQAVVAPPPPPKPKAKPKKEMPDEYVYATTMDEYDEKEATQAKPDEGYAQRFTARLKVNLQMETPLKVPAYDPTNYKGTPWGRLTGETIPQMKRAYVPRASDGKTVYTNVPTEAVYKGDPSYDRGVGLGLFYNGGSQYWADDEVRGISKEDGAMYHRGAEDGWLIRRSMMEAVSNNDVSIRKVLLTPLLFSELYQRLPDALKSYTMPRGVRRRRKSDV